MNLHQLLWIVCLMAPTIGTSAGKINGLALWFEQGESRQENELSRVLIAEQFMRIDDGNNEGDFILFDRLQKIIYAVSHDTQTILKIQPKQISKPEHQFQLTVRHEVDLKAPAVMGVKPVLYHFVVDQQTCMNAVVLPGQLSLATKALQDYRQTLAFEHYRVQQLEPSIVRGDCDQVRHVVAPTWYLKYGIPIQAWDDQGYHQRLANYDLQYKIDMTLFELPKNYTTIMP